MITYYFNETLVIFSLEIVFLLSWRWSFSTMKRAWDKEKFWVPDGNRTHGLPDTGIWEAMGSIPVRDSEFFFVPCSCHCWKRSSSLFITELKIYHLYYLLLLSSFSSYYILDSPIWFFHLSFLTVCKYSFAILLNTTDKVKLISLQRTGTPFW